MGFTVMERLQDIFRDIFGDMSIQLTEEMDAQDIDGWDSLRHISILAAVQDEFGVSFDMDEIMKMNNVGDMVKAIGDEKK